MCARIVFLVLAAPVLHHMLLQAGSRPVLSRLRKLLFVYDANLLTDRLIDGMDGIEKDRLRFR